MGAFELCSALAIKRDSRGHGPDPGYSDHNRYSSRAKSVDL